MGHLEWIISDLWKTYPTKIYQYLFSFVQIRGWSRPVSGKFIPSSILEFRFMISGKLIQSMYSRNDFQRIVWDVTLTDRSSPFPGNWNFEKCWMSFPEIGHCHAPDNWNFGKNSVWGFPDLPIRVQYYWYCNIILKSPDMTLPGAKFLSICNLIRAFVGTKTALKHS